MSWKTRMLKTMLWSVVVVATFCVALVLLAILALSKVPRSYPPAKHAIPPPTANSALLGGALANFTSPYLGHTGSWDGKGGGMFGASKAADLHRESAMGLKWTFMPVYWRALEPKGPVDLNSGTPAEWLALDQFVISAQKHHLNILMQAPVVGGNAGGPPEWAGVLLKGSSAPTNIDAAADFAGKLAARYCPGGTLATAQAWGTNYGVRAWELDNEPESYRTSWSKQPGAYAEFAAKVAARLKKIDPLAVIVAPGIGGGGGKGLDWVEAGIPGEKGFSLGPVIDVVSFHCYEGLDSALSKDDRTIERAFSDISAVFEKHERDSLFPYPPKIEYWHTEGNFDFLGILSKERRAAWRFQFFTRAFAAGIRKVCVMDASVPEQQAIRAYVQALPNPFPMISATDQLHIINGQAVAFMHPDTDSETPVTTVDASARSGRNRVWILWAVANTGDALVELPVNHARVRCIGSDGQQNELIASNGKLQVQLKGDKKMAPGVLVLDRAQ